MQLCQKIVPRLGVLVVLSSCSASCSPSGEPDSPIAAPGPSRPVAPSIRPAADDPRNVPAPSGLSLALVRNGRIEPLPFVQLPEGDFDVRVDVHLVPAGSEPTSAYGPANRDTF